MRTAESVSPMHPDKICDRISDAILDACLAQDRNTRAAIETMGGHGIITITGELTTEAYVNPRKIAHQIAEKSYGVQVNIVEQSHEIANGVDTGGAGDQGIMVGYATNETLEMIPLETKLARSLNKFIFSRYPFDGKTQVTLVGNRVSTVVASFQNIPKADLDRLVMQWIEYEKINPRDMNIYCNPAGDWELGGFDADTGLTGRKIMVDNYGPRIPVGGGAFSGKDATKVDRSGAYMARKIAVDILKARQAKEVYCYLAYAIGMAEPLQATVLVDGIEEPVKGYDLTPKGIIDFLDLKKPQYEMTARYGHFGNGFTWDK